MKKLSLLAAFFCLFLAGAVFAQQKAANFAGSWELDAAKSKLPERMRIESMTLKVAQTDKELKVETNVRRAPRPEGEMPNGGNVGAPPPPPPMPPDGNRGNGTGAGVRGGRGGMMGGGNGTVTYSLDGKDTTVGTVSPDGVQTSSVTLRAKMESDGKLTLTSSRSFETPNGTMSVKTTDVWELLDGGKTLKVVRDTETARGTQSSEMYFTKKAVSEAQIVIAPVAPAQTTIVSDGDAATQSPKIIKSGVLNGKVLKLVQPEYPPAARAVRASGAVAVQITFDEKGSVISAAAISGHPLLRAAAEKAARACKFAPVLLEGVPVKVTGVIVYNFVP